MQPFNGLIDSPANRFLVHSVSCLCNSFSWIYFFPCQVCTHICNGEPPINFSKTICVSVIYVECNYMLLCSYRFLFHLISYSYTVIRHIRCICPCIFQYGKPHIKFLNIKVVLICGHTSNIFKIIFM
jgi:hypothetical protein